MSELHSSLHTPQLFIRITPAEDVPFQRFTFKSFMRFCTRNFLAYMKNGNFIL